ncbi:hypothetical protein [Chitinimonas sp.]|uniref:hypothetical protein n=1 Tax=Chitinimonas sp. TaxID=1934313 RepID=UPI002F93156F
MNWLKRLFGAATNRPAAVVPPVVTLQALDPDIPIETVLAATRQARHSSYRQLGKLLPLVPEADANSARWPALRQGWSVITRPASTLLASDGLSDPFGLDDSPPQALGFGLEVYAEALGHFDDLAHSWLFELVRQVSQHVADHGNFLSLLQRHQFLTMLLHVDGIPAEWRGPDGAVGILIGLPASGIPSGFETPYGPVRLAAITLLCPEELAFLEEGDITQGRHKLAGILLRTPPGHMIDLRRSAVVSYS